MNAPRSAMPARTARTARSVLPALLSAAILLAGCSSGPEKKAGPATPSATVTTTRTPSSTVGVPRGVSLTAQGSTLSFGDSARVIFESTRKRGTVLRLTVRSVRKGTLKDFDGFILDDRYKQKASYFYATVTVKNVGRGDVGGVAVPLWGVDRSETLLPPVTFTTRFAPCPTRRLPARFGPGAALTTCLVFLSPGKGGLAGVSYRPSQQFDPVTWSGPIRRARTR